MKKTSILFALLIFFSIARAAERDAASLAEYAKKQLLKMHSDSDTRRKVRKLECTCTLTLSQENVVAYSAEGYGTVFLSKDDKFRPVLGYTNTVISADCTLPCCLQYWLRDICRQMEDTSALVLPDGAHRVRQKSQAYVSVAPFVDTKWGQGSPYNSFTPVIDGINAPTGCVATSFAQILNYHEWPKSASFSSRYSIDGGSNFKDAEVSTTYKYPYKKAYGAYSADGSEENIESISYNIMNKRDIGIFLRDCGYACEMMYGANASSSYTSMIGIAAINHMSYPRESVKYAARHFFSDEEWYNIIYSELQRGCPIAYGGQDEKSGGHSFIIHGMDADGLVYVNWGWQGLCDGYYAIDLMNADDMSFCYNQDMVYGLRPTAYSDETIESLWASEMYKIYNTEDSDSLMFSANPIYNYSCNDFKGYLMFVFEKETNGDKIVIQVVTPDDGIVAPLTGYKFRDVCLSDIVASELVAGETYKFYLASSTEEEFQTEKLRKVRVAGGQIYYTLKVGDKGKFTVCSSSYDTTTNIERVNNTKETFTQKCHDISGREINTNKHRGIVIKNGRKYIAK